MATTDLVVNSIIDATGWTGATVANLEASNDSRATDGNKNEFIRAELTDAPGDFGSLNSVTLKVEGRITGATSRDRQFQVDLMDSGNNVLESFTTAVLDSTSDVLFTSSAFTRSDSQAVIDGYRIQVTVLEGGGMADGQTVEIDWMAVELNYEIAAFTVDMDAGGFTLSGQDNTVTKQSLINADAGSLTFTGQDANITLDVNVPMALGALTFTGLDNTLSLGGGIEVLGTNSGNTGSDSQTSHTVNLPASIESGDVLFVHIHGNKQGGPTGFSFPEGWTQIVDVNGTNLINGAAHRTADGTEGSTITVTSDAASHSAHISYRVGGASGTVEVEVAAQANTANPDPPSITPSWGSKESLFLACVGGNWTNNIEDTAPTGYTNQLRSNQEFTGTGAALSAERVVETGTEDPGTFALTEAQENRAFTVAFEPAAAAGTTVDMGLGSLTFSGLDPSVTRSLLVSPNVGSLSFSGLDAGVTRSLLINQDVGGFTFSGQTAGITRSLLSNMDAGSLTFSGLDNTVTVSINVPMGLGALTFAGQDASLTRALLANMDAGSLSLSGLSADVTRSLLLGMDAGGLTFSGQDAGITLSLNLPMDSASFTFSGLDPSVVRSLLLSMDAGSLTFTGRDASVSTEDIIAMDAGALSFSGLASTVLRSLLAEMDAGSLTFSGQDASLSTASQIQMDLGALTLSGLDPVLTRSLLMNMEAGGLTLNGLVASVVTDLIVNLDSGSLEFSGQDAVITRAVPVDLDAGAFSLSGLDAGLTRQLRFEADAGALTFNGQAATITVTLGIPAPDGRTLGVGARATITISTRKTIKVPAKTTPTVN